MVSERWALPGVLSRPHCWQLPAGAETKLLGKAKSAFRESWAQGDRLCPVRPGWFYREALGPGSDTRPLSGNDALGPGVQGSE